MGHSLRFILLALLSGSMFFFADIVPYEVRSFCYALSLSVKEILVFLLPFVVFSVVFYSVSRFNGERLLSTTVLLLVMVAVSNSGAACIAYLVGSTVLDSGGHKVVYDMASGESLVPMYNTFSMPLVVSPAHALISGFLFGIVAPKLLGRKKVDAISNRLYGASIFILDRVFNNILPFFLVGFIFKIHSENALQLLSGNYRVILCILVPPLLYVVFLYWLGSGLSIIKALKSIKNMGVAALTGFVTMSSLVTMPITLKAVQKNTDDSPLSFIAVPGSVNIHLVGDCFFSVVLLLFISYVFGSEPLSASDIMHFLSYVVLLKFAEAAVAGTGLLLMLPVIEQYLHFSPSMVSIAATLYILVDPLITVFNILGNGAFSMLFVKVGGILSKQTRNI